MSIERSRPGLLWRVWVVGVVAVCAFGLSGCDEELIPTHQSLEIGEKSFNLELALTQEQISRGLMHREELAVDGGMLFVFPAEAQRSFWMKNCKIDLDILFLDKTGRVVRKTRMFAPDPNIPDNQLPRYSSKYPAQFAIELAAGETDKLKVKEGDVVALPLERLKELVE